MLHGETGNDWLGVSGNFNTLFGGAGNDFLGATGNNNTLDGGTGNDTMVAPPAAHQGDVFNYRPGYAQDEIIGFARHNAGGTDVVSSSGVVRAAARRARRAAWPRSRSARRDWRRSLAGDVGRGAVLGLRDARGRAPALSEAREAEAAGDLRCLVGQDVAEHVGGDDDVDLTPASRTSSAAMASMRRSS